MLNGQTALVVEEEFLIALDLQRMLEGHGVGQTLFSRTADEARALEAHWPSLGLAVVEIHPKGAGATALVQDLRARGVAVVLMTGDSAFRLGHPDFPGIQVVVKPIAEDQLATAINQALSTH